MSATPPVLAPILTRILLSCLLVQKLCKSKVSQLDIALVAEQNVGGLQVPMRNTLVVDVAESFK